MASKNYLNGNDFRLQVILSQEKDEVTPECLKMYLLMVDKIQLKFRYKDPFLKEDCRSAAILRFFKYFRSFKNDRSTNAFAYFTSLATKAMAEEFNRWQYEKAAPSVEEKIHRVSLDQLPFTDF